MLHLQLDLDGTFCTSSNNSLDRFDNEEFGHSRLDLERHVLLLWQDVGYFERGLTTFELQLIVRLQLDCLQHFFLI